MLSKREIRIVLFHEFKLGHSAAQTTGNAISACDKCSTSERSAARVDGSENASWILQSPRSRGTRSAIEVEGNGRCECKNIRKSIAEELNVDRAAEARHQTKVGKMKHSVSGCRRS